MTTAALAFRRHKKPPPTVPRTPPLPLMIGNVRPLEPASDRATPERISWYPNQVWIWLEEGRLPLTSPHQDPDPPDVVVPAPRSAFYHRIPSLQVSSAEIRIQEVFSSGDLSDSVLYQVAWRLAGQILIDPVVALLGNPEAGRDSRLRRPGSYRPRKIDCNHPAWKPADSGTKFRPINMELGEPPLNLGQTGFWDLRCILVPMFWRPIEFNPYAYLVLKLWAVLLRFESFEQLEQVAGMIRRGGGKEKKIEGTNSSVLGK